ncbi:hypothetical protein BC827DRAFT_830200 [Russula dissimulans]|nr:hypothetical protein BC827DRAFT_830200 [Russula dissimulans]
MPQLETLVIGFHSATSNSYVYEKLSDALVMPRITLPNLRQLGFGGVPVYLETLLPQITAPLLNKLDIRFFKQLIFFVPHMAQFMSTIKSLGLSGAALLFDDRSITLKAKQEAITKYALNVEVECPYFDFQIAAARRIVNSLQPLLSTVVDLTLPYRGVGLSLEWDPDAPRTQWRGLLRPFSNVKVLLVDKDLVAEISRSLRLEDQESPMELLPELSRLECRGSNDTMGAFASFIDARRNSCRPVTLAIISA